MLRGYTIPRTPQGRSELTPAPPWHYSGDCIAVEYWADVTAVGALLPPGLEPDGSSDGRSLFWFTDGQFTGGNDELTDPARYQFREAFVLVEARLGGRPVNYCPYSFVDNDAAIARAWIQGYPTKLGSIFLTRSFTAPGPAAAPVAQGSRFGAGVSAHGERMATARVQLENQVPDPRSILNRPTTMRRYLPTLTCSSVEKQAIDELALSLMDDLSFSDMWTGSAELELPTVAGEDMHMIAPVRVGRGYRFGMAYTVSDLPILKDYKSKAEPQG